jgi:hypothetical protein
MDKLVLNLEHQIAFFLSSDNKSQCTVHFDYKEEYLEKGNIGKNPSTEWTAIAQTFNPVTDETFLLKTETASTKEKALKKILDYLKKQKGESPFTVKWMKKGDNSTKQNESHFYCHDILGVVENFFHGKNPEDYIVHEIKLNPIS